MQKIKLTDIPIFQFIDQSLAQTLSDCSQMIEKKEGQAILLEDEPTPGLFIIVNGTAEVFLGQEKKPAFHLQTGEVFGEMALIDQAKASATIRAAKGGTKLIYIHKETFAKELQNNPELERGFYKGTSTVLSKRIRQSNTKITGEMQQLDSVIGSYSPLSSIAERLGKVQEISEALITRIDEIEKLLNPVSPKLAMEVKDLDPRVKQQLKEINGILETFMNLPRTA